MLIFSAFNDHLEHAEAIRFFLYYSKNHSEFHGHLLSQGVPSLLSCMKALTPKIEQPKPSQASPSDWIALGLLCGSLTVASGQIWAVSRLVELDVYSVLNLLLL
jgi:hypothetical protein